MLVTARRRSAPALAAAATAAFVLLSTGAAGGAGPARQAREPGPCQGTSAADPANPSSQPATDRDAARRLAMSRRVFVVGDSLTVQAASYIRGGLARRVAGVDIDAAISRFTPTGVRILHSSRAARAHVWVVALGTNDSPDPGQMRSAVRQVMRQARGRKVLWVNVVRPGGYERVNRELASQADRYCNLDVLDWSGAVRGHRGWLAGDGVHTTEAGSRARGHMTAQQVLALARRT